MRAYRNDTITPKQPKRLPILRYGFLFLLAVVLLISCVNLVIYTLDSSKTRYMEAQMRGEIALLFTDEPSVSNAPMSQDPVPTQAANSTAQTDSAASASVQDKLKGARKLNPDTMGLLTAGSDIGTYVVQRDNMYYLTHSIYQEESTAGAVFADEDCSLKKPSQHIVLYGHNMSNGTAFGKLRDFEKDTYLNIFPILHFATENDDGYYLIIAAFHCSVDPKSSNYFNIRTFEFSTQDDFLAYVQKAKLLSSVNISDDIRSNDQIVSLCTCTHASNKDDRFIVMARKLRKGETAESFNNRFPSVARDLYYKNGMPYIKGDDVLSIQKALVTLGYIKDSCDGIYGASTAEAVSVFQADHQLPADGIVGSKTREMIFRILQDK